jgi:transcriptional regulator with GAF, ATPase, and Fis domain
MLQSQLLKRSRSKAAMEAPPSAAGTASNGNRSVDHPNSPAADSQAPAAAAATESPTLMPGLIGTGPRIRELFGLVRKVAASQSAVLLRGETGTGKEVLARVIHENSPRASGPFVKVHCAALSAGLLESELFGHVKGAFTTAIRDKVGRFEAANGGTLFLDEIGDINLEVQTKLLRVLQEKTFERVGSSESIQVDVRIVAATHQNLEELIRQARFREDLYYRLNVFPIQVPPLRERIEDIPELVLHFLKTYSQRAAKDCSSIDDDALAVLKGYPWPGNVRQLENVIERAVVVADGPVVTVAELPPDLLLEQTPFVDVVSLTAKDVPADDLSDAWALQPAADVTLPDLAQLVHSERALRERREREAFVRALAEAGGNKAEAARALGMARSTLLSRLKRLGLG